MKKLLQISLCFVFALTVVCSFSACHTHVHVLEWRQNQTKHWQVCTANGCDGSYDEQRGEHVGYPCEICGPAFNAIAFYTGINDQAHVSFVNEANAWFDEAAHAYNFVYNSTNDWSKLNDDFLSDYDVVLFLDTRPEEARQRQAFERYMENGGAWMGFHFSAFALDNSAYVQDWDWYHDEFLGSGQYVSNTWEPTAELLKVETHDHFATENLPDTFESMPCEWYAWEHDLRENDDITILLSIDESSFPVGNNKEKPWEIWHEGYYPVAWTNNNYNMIYMNMGHNLVTYGNNSKDLSATFGSEIQNRFVIDGLFGMIQQKYL